jgi:lysozyme
MFDPDAHIPRPNRNLVYFGACIIAGLLQHLSSRSRPFAGGITEEQATALLRQDVAYAQHAVAHHVTVPLTQGQYDALVSFTYNEGAGRLQSSTLLKVLRGGTGAVGGVVYGGAVKLPGLVTRCAAEAAMFLG